MKKVLGRIYRIIMVLIIALGLAFIILCAFRIVTVVRGNGPSMEPTMKDGERYLMIKVDLEHIKRGDIIGAELSDGTRVTKRVIGLPGEHICIGYSSIWINGDWISEPYLEYPGWNDFGDYDIGLTLKENQFYLMGDNRRGGTWCGIVTSEQIIGKVIGK
ncbi:MAG: signal peptidase I [Clostridia bacterium]|nr:signal peptidase I [Clostridia bacterium]